MTTAVVPKLSSGAGMDVTMMVGESRAMDELRARVNRVARTSFTVLVEGESGAGKELVAREIHAQSPRHRGPFVAVNCAALVETLVEAELFGIEERTATGVRGRRGKFELADRGTLFLDEVADLSPTSQAKLLRVLQDMTVERIGGYTASKVDTRIVVATNRDLRGMVGHGLFRTDLYYRLSGVEIVVPPLRTRREDIPLLVRHFLAQHAQGAAITVDSNAAQALLAYDWPGNIRQLGRVLERAVALAPRPEITIADLPDEVRHVYEEVVGYNDGCNDTLRAWSSRYVSLVLARCKGNKRRACQILDISYHTLKSHLMYNARPLQGSTPPAESYGTARAAPSLNVDPPGVGPAA
jgi:transcriptional regulator with PAS, ATPase and Fis domain